jgi:hypothetical protein
MSSPSLIVVRDDSLMAKSGPRAGSPSSRRVFTPAEKLQHLTAYEEANGLRAVVGIFESRAFTRLK